jgi:hypothetical protein
MVVRMNNFATRARRRSVAGLVTLTAAGLGASGAGMLSASSPPTSTTVPEGPPPIAVEELTRIDENTLVRGEFTDDMSASFRIGYEGTDPMTIDVPNLSRMAVARITIQPGARFPWHTHPGPVLVTVTQGELVYVMADDCVERSYAAGTGFVDHGHGMIHAAMNPTDGETVVIATFLEVTADGPLTITDGVTGPADDCGLAPTGTSGARRVGADEPV